MQQSYVTINAAALLAIAVSCRTPAPMAESKPDHVVGCFRRLYADGPPGSGAGAALYTLRDVRPYGSTVDSLTRGAAFAAELRRRTPARVVRAAELFCSINNHKFPWFDVFGAIAEMHPASALSSAARLEDRQDHGKRRSSTARAHGSEAA